MPMAVYNAWLDQLNMYQRLFDDAFQRKDSIMCAYYQDIIDDIKSKINPNNKTAQDAKIWR